MRLPRFRFTIAHLMALVVIAGLALAVLVMRIERNRRIAALQVALANCESAKLTLEVAKIALLEYTEGVFKQDLQTVDTEISLAKSDLDRALNPRDSDEQAVDQARGKLERAQQKKARLETYTKDKTVKELNDEVAKAAAAKQAAQSSYDRLKAATNAWW